MESRGVMDNVRVAEAARFLLEAARADVSLERCRQLAWAARLRGLRPQGMVFWAVLNALDPRTSMETAESLVWTLFRRGALVMVPWFVRDSRGEDVESWSAGLLPEVCGGARDAYRMLWRVYLARLPLLSFGALGAAVGRFAEWRGCTDEEFGWLCAAVRERCAEGEFHYRMRYEEPVLEGVGAVRWRELWFRALDDARRLGRFCPCARVDELGREAERARAAALQSVRSRLRHSREVVVQLVEQFLGTANSY